MKKWMIYTLIVAVAVAIVLIATIPALLNKEPVMELPVQVVNQGEKLSVDLKAFIKDEKADEVTLEKVDGPGTITGSVFTFEPAFKYVGEVIVKIKATDKQGKNSTGELKINVIRVNRPPEIDTTPLKVFEGESMSLDLLTIVKDPDNDEISLKVDGPGNLEGRTYVYAPGYMDAGKKVLRITAKDSEGNETVRDVQLEVVDVNAPPTLVVSDQTVREGDSLTVDLASLVSDTDGDAVTLSLIGGPGGIVDGVFVYKPGFEEAGESVVSISARDSRGGESTSTFKVTVTETNRPPRIFLSDMVISEGEELVVDLSSRMLDPDDDPLEIIVEGPGAVEDNRYVFTPGYRDAGDKDVAITISDGKGGIGRASFTIRVQDVNRPPEGSIANETISEGEKLNLYLKAFAYDPDGDEIFFELLEGPGSVEGDSYTYEPDFESAGLKEVKIKVSDAGGEEKILVFEIAVVDVNRAPVAVLPSIAASIRETFTLGLDLKSFFTDPDGEELSFAILEGPGSIEGSNYKYTPSYNDQGEKKITIVASDPSGLSTNLPVTVSVMDLNREPRVLTSDVSIDENEPLTIDFNGWVIDPDGDSVEISIKGPGSIKDGIYTFKPGYNDSGEHTVKVHVRDERGAMKEASFTILVNDVNRPPRMLLSDKMIDEGTRLVVDLGMQSIDLDGDELNFTLVEGPGSVENAIYTFEPSFEESGDYTVTIRVSDGQTSVTGEFMIEVVDVNRAPETTIKEIKSSIREGFSLGMNLATFFGDPDGDELTFSLEGPGTLEGNGYTYSPGYEDSGEKSVLVTANDGRGGSVTLPIIISVLDINRPPEGSIANETISEGEKLNLYLKAFAYDPDGDEIFFELLEGPGSVEGDSYTYEPDFESAGLKEVKIKVSDAGGEEKILVFEIAVVDVNRAPVAVLPSIAASIRETFTLGLDLKSFFTDPDGEELSFAILEGPGSIEGSNYKYTPLYNDQGEKKITIVASDPSGLSTNLPVTVSVMDLNREPRVLTSDVSIDENEPLTIDFNGWVIDPDGDSVEISIEGPGSIKDGIYTFKPGYNDSGEHTVKVHVRDERGATKEASFTILVNDVNRPPEGSIANETISEGEKLNLYLKAFAYDPDGDEIFFELLEGPGSVEGDSYTYEPDFESAGLKEVKIKVSDAVGEEKILVFEIEIVDENRVPLITSSLPEITVQAEKVVEIDLMDHLNDPDGDDLLFEILEGPGSITGSKYIFEPRIGDIGQKEVLIKVSDGKGELTVPLRIFVEAGHRVVSITYALFSSGIDKVKLIAGSHEIISSGQRAELEIDWPLDFDTVSLWSFLEESAELIGTAKITASSSSRNIPLVSERGETKGFVRIELK